MMDHSNKTICRIQYISAKTECCSMYMSRDSSMFDKDLTRKWRFHRNQTLRSYL